MRIPIAPVRAVGARIEASWAGNGRQATQARQALRGRTPGSPDTDRFWGWLAPLAVAVVGGALRFWRLDRPPWIIFDETYYVKHAASLLRFGHEMAVKVELSQGQDADKLWNTGNTDVWGTQAAFVVHPPGGKWMIAIGELLFGPTSPWGWRFASAVVGTLSILMLGRIARRLFRSTLLGTTAALLLAVDGQHFVHSRVGLLDVFVMFWALAAFGCLLIDRDQARDGPRRRLRPWRLAAGVCFGLCVSTKWSGLFFAAAFGLAAVLWDASARRAAGQRHWLITALMRDGASAAVHMLPVALVVYVSSWTGWLRSTDGYERQWAAQHPSDAPVPDALRSLWHYHQVMWQSNVTLRTPHSFQSHPWSWLVLGRPTLFDNRGYRRGESGCDYESCSRMITALGNPMIWWGGTLAIAVLLVVWLLGRDWRAGAILAGVAGGYLPWFLYAERTIYTFYAVAFVPYVVLALTYCLGLVLGRPDAPPERRLTGAALAGSVVVLAVIAFGYFYPVLSDQLISHPQLQDRMWLRSWWYADPVGPQTSS